MHRQFFRYRHKEYAVWCERLLHSGDFTKIKPALPLYERANELDQDFIDARLGLADLNFQIWRGSFNTIRFTLEALADV